MQQPRRGYDATKEVQISWRIPRDLHARLVALAKKERRSLNSQVTKMLEDALPPDPDSETRHD